MKILHLSAEKTWRGGEQQIAYLVEESLAQGLEILVACQKGSAFESYCIEHSIPHFSISFRRLAGLPAALAIKKICLSHEIDLIHAHSSHAHGPAVISSSLGNDVPIILSRKVIIPVKDKFISRWKYNHPGIKRIICVSQAVADVMAPSLTTPEKLFVVPDGIDLNRFEPPTPRGIFRKEFQIADRTPLIINIAALSHDKDLFTFLRTAKSLHEQLPEARFLIAGEGPMRTELETEIQHLGLQSYVTLTGFRKDIPALLQDSDLFLTTSRSEGLGSSILDAFATRTPVIATSAGGIVELVQHGKTGLLAPVGDIKALTSQITEILNNPTLASDLTENAYRFLCEKFEKSIMASTTISHYRKVLQHHAAVL